MFVQFKNGFVSYSAPIVVEGPCPGHTSVSRGSVISFSLIPRDQQVMVPPEEVGTADAAVEQHIAANQQVCLLPVYRQMLPGEWPGTWRMCNIRSCPR